MRSIRTVAVSSSISIVLALQVVTAIIVIIDNLYHGNKRQGHRADMSCPGFQVGSGLGKLVAVAAWALIFESSSRGFRGYRCRTVEITRVRFLI